MQTQYSTFPTQTAGRFIPMPSIVPAHDDGAALARPVRNLHDAGQLANGIARRKVFADHVAGLSANTERSHRAALALFAEFLADVKDAKNLPDDTPSGDELMTSPAAWAFMTFGLLELYREWLLSKGYAIGTVNGYMGKVRAYCKLAHKAGTLSESEAYAIAGVKGISGRKAANVDERRDVTRIGHKKAGFHALDEDECEILKGRVPDSHPDADELREYFATEQGLRDRVIMTLLVDHGMRVSELSHLAAVGDVNLKTGIMEFDRPKIGDRLRHRLTPDALDVLREWDKSGAWPATDRLLRSTGSKAAGWRELGKIGMGETGINQRVRWLGQRLLGIEDLSPHDLRHTCATHMAELGYNVREMCDWFGWASPSMAFCYIKAAETAERSKG